MLITQEVEVGLSSNNIKYYEDLGYIIPKYKDTKHNMVVKKGTKTIVKTTDLQNGSNAQIKIECDDCGKELTLLWSTYYKGAKQGKYYCIKCAKKLYGTEKYKRTRLSKGTSFQQWCIQNDRQDILNRWDTEKNKCEANEVNFSTNKKYWIKCPNEIHSSELKNLNNFIHGHLGSMDCISCNSFAQWGIDNLGEDFLEKYWSINNVGINPWEFRYRSHKQVFIKCQKKDYHYDYKIICDAFVGGNRCPQCNTFASHGKVHPLDSLGKILEDKELLEIWSDKNTKSPYEYSPYSTKKVWWKCQDSKHKDYFRAICESTTYDFHCIQCSRERTESFLQEKTRLYLESLGYNVLHEYECNLTCINPKTKFKLPYDNEVVELKLIIEIHGEQHYKRTSKWIDTWSKKKNMTADECLHYMKVKDRYKRIFAKSHGFYYLEIPFWEDNKSENWKQLIDNKISEIQLNTIEEKEAV